MATAPPDFFRTTKSARATVAAVTAVAVFGLALVFVAPASAVLRASLRTPARNCNEHIESALTLSIRTLDGCRAKEDLGPLQLPTNYSRLTISQQMLVVIDLERVNRGLAPVLGLTPSLNALAQKAADTDQDPAFPAGRYSVAGSIWAYAFSVIGADVGWMYDDGWGGTVTNLDCTSAVSSGCWAHRRIVLMHPGGGLVAGAGFRRLHSDSSTISAGHSYAFEIVSGYPSAHLTFSWKHELNYFRTRPGLEPRRR